MKQNKNPACVDAQTGRGKINGKAGLPNQDNRRALIEQVFCALLLIETALLTAGLTLMAIEIVALIGGLV